MIETWLNLFGLLSGAFLLIDFQLQAPALHGDSHEKWIKETRLDISAGSRAEDNGPQENPRRPNCQEVETDRRRHAPKSVQYGIVTRLALTTRSLRIFLLRSPASRGAFFGCLYTSVWRASARQLASFLYSRSLASAIDRSRSQVAWCAEPLSLTPRVITSRQSKRRFNIVSKPPRIEAHLSPVQAPVGLIDMLRVRIGPAPPARDALDVEIGHLRVSAFDERLVLLRNLREHRAFRPPFVHRSTPE